MVKKIFLFFFLFFSFLARSSSFNELSSDDKLHQKKIKLAEKLYHNNQFSESSRLCYTILNSNSSIPIKCEARLILSNNLLVEYDFNKALELLHTNVKDINNEIFVSKNTNLGVILLKSYVSLAKIYLEKKKDKAKSIEFYKRIIEYPTNKEGKFALYKAEAFSTLSSIYVTSDDFTNIKEAEIFSEKAIETYDKLKDSIGLGRSYGNLANIYLQKKKYTTSEAMNNKALSLLQNQFTFDAVNLISKIHYNSSITSYNLKKFKLAYEQLNESFIVRDSLISKKYNKDLADLEYKYNLNIVKKDAENEQLRLEKTIVIVVLVALILLVILGYFINNFKLKQKNLALKLSKTELEQNKKLDKIKSESQDKILNAAIDGKELERKEIAEFLHDSVSALLSSANMHLSAAKNRFKGQEIPSEISKTQEIIHEAGNKIRDLSHNLVSSVLLKFGLEYAVNDLSKKISNSELDIHVDSRNIRRYSKEKEIKVFNIIQELINNALKHSQSSNIFISLEDEKNQLLICIEDDGVGFNVIEIEKQSTGLGLNQIAARVRTMKGEFKIDSAYGEGTRINIEIPTI